jgi:hypothetical protein
MIKSIAHDQPQKNFKYLWLEFERLERSAAVERLERADPMMNGATRLNGLNVLNGWNEPRSGC